MQSEPKYTCPKCGGHDYGSSKSFDGIVTRHCHGWLPNKNPCLFNWPESEDRHYIAEELTEVEEVIE